MGALEAMKEEPMEKPCEMTEVPANRFVYVAGPMGDGPEREANVKLGMEAAARLADHGWVPFLPHLNHYWELHIPRSRIYWMSWDLAWLSRCGSVCRLPGYSPGSDIEEAAAAGHLIPVVHGVDAFLETFGTGW